MVTSLSENEVINVQEQNFKQKILLNYHRWFAYIDFQELVN